VQEKTMNEKNFDFFDDATRKDLIDAWRRASKAGNTPAADVAEAALSAVNDAEAAVAEASGAVSTAEAVLEGQ
jgi:hypothetical protein